MWYRSPIGNTSVEHKEYEERKKQQEIAICVDGVIQIRFLSNYPMGEKYNSYGLSNQRDSKSIEELKPNGF